MLYTIGLGNQALLQTKPPAQKIASLYDCDTFAKKIVPEGFDVYPVRNLLGWLQQVEKQGATHVVEVGADGSPTPPMEIGERINDLRIRETIQFEN